MKLSDTDRENIEVLEALDVDEHTLLLLLILYFEYRGQFSYSPDKALQATIRSRVNERMKAEDTAHRRSQGAKDGWEIRRGKKASKGQ